MIPLQDSQPLGPFPWTTVLIIMVNAVVFAIEATTPNLDTLLQKFALIPATVMLHNPATWLPLISAQFFHSGIVHIATNMIFLWVFGRNVEARMSWLYLPFYLVGGIIGGVSQIAIAPHTTVPIIGASGAIAAVLGAYIVWYARHTIKTLVPIFGFFTILPVPAFMMLGYWFLAQLLSGVGSFTAVGIQTTAIAYFDHIGGFVFGMMLALLVKPAINPPS